MDMRALTRGLGIPSQRRQSYPLPFAMRDASSGRPVLVPAVLTVALVVALAMAGAFGSKSVSQDTTINHLTTELTSAQQQVSQSQADASALESKLATAQETARSLRMADSLHATQLYETRGKLGQQMAVTQHVRAQLAASVDQLSAATRLARLTAARLDTTRAVLSDTQAALTQAENDTRTLAELLVTQSHDNDDLYACLRGYMDVVDALLKNDLSTARAVLNAVTTTCRRGIANYKHLDV